MSSRYALRALIGWPVSWLMKCSSVLHSITLSLVEYWCRELTAISGGDGATTSWTYRSRSYCSACLRFSRSSSICRWSVLLWLIFSIRAAYNSLLAFFSFSKHWLT